jgi:hypothetical protein
MNKSFLVTKVAPHLVAVITFLMISIFIYRPIIFEGKVMDQNDINQGIGANQEIVEFRDSTGEEALWTNSMFSGMPAYLINVRWSGTSILWNTQRVLTLFLPQPVGENFLAFLAFYILCLAFGIRPYLAIAGAIAFGLSTFFLISVQAGHIWKIRAIAYMPALLAGVKLVFDRNYVWGFLLSAFSLAFLINTNHLQIAYYFFILLAVYGSSELIFALQSNAAQTFFGKVAILAIAALLAIGATFGKLWSTYEYGKFSIRGKSELSEGNQSKKDGLDPDYVFRWSNGKWETMMLLVPHIYGGASGVYSGSGSEVRKLLERNNVPKNEINQIERVYLGYWGKLPGTAGPAYAGAVVVSLFILSLFLLEGRFKYWMVFVIMLSIMLSWGKNFPSFNNLMFDFFPLYNKFRAVTMVIILALMVIPLMAMLGVERLMELDWNKDAQKKVLLSFAIGIGVSLLVLLFTNPPQVEGIQQAIANAIKNDRSAIVRKDVFRTILYVILTFSAVLLLLRKKLSSKGFIGILVLLVVLDLALVDSRYLNDSVYKRPDEKSYLSATPADLKILKDVEQGYRVLNLQDPFNEARTSFFHRSIGGYHGAKIRRYQDVISKHLAPEIQQILKDRSLTKANSGVISMLNTKYLLAGYKENAVIMNEYYQGAAWIADKIVFVTSPDEEIAALNNVNLRSEAIVDKSKFIVSPVKTDTTASIDLVRYQPNKLLYESSTSSSAFAVFSEIYYPKGWKAFIDGKEIEIVRANYILRALEIPAGNHQIEFRFEPQSYLVGNKVMWMSSVLLLLLLVASLAKKLIIDKSN